MDIIEKKTTMAKLGPEPSSQVSVNRHDSFYIVDHQASPKNDASKPIVKQPVSHSSNVNSQIMSDDIFYVMTFQNAI